MALYGPDGRPVAISGCVPLEYFQIVHAHAARKANFLRDTPGMDYGISALIAAAQLFAKESGAKIEQLVPYNPMVSSEGIFSVQFLVIPARIVAKPRRTPKRPVRPS